MPVDVSDVIVRKLELEFEKASWPLVYILNLKISGHNAGSIAIQVHSIGIVCRRVTVSNSSIVR